MFKALLLKQEENKKATVTVEDIDVSKLPEGDVLVKINYSTINYKDSLAITSSSPIVKNFPMVPGIDFSGEVEETSNENFKIGDKVILMDLELEKSIGVDWLKKLELKESG